MILIILIIVIPLYIFVAKIVYDTLVKVDPSSFIGYDNEVNEDYAAAAIFWPITLIVVGIKVLFNVITTAFNNLIAKPTSKISDYISERIKKWIK